MKITTVRTLTIADGQTQAAALEAARKIAASVKKELGRDVRIFTPLGGPTNTVSFVGDYASLAAFEEGREAANSNAKFQEAIAATQGVFNGISDAFYVDQS